ncbi:hypothetical protein T492DRAFT_846982 [Pavlovales sp. CCMP2436]|nr:hypothetical protein T492DRAFT_846982 [Pavlovales sp. CCMP2436]
MLQIAPLQDSPASQPATQPQPQPQPQPVAVPVAKPKRVPSAAQRLNYLKANARRLEILADAKAIRLAAASELKANQDAINEYELALRRKKFGSKNRNSLVISRSQTNWGTYVDAASALTGCTISNAKLHISQVSSQRNTSKVLRESAVTNTFSRKMISLRTKAGMIDYQFRVGSMVYPQSAIDCTNSAAETRAELARAFGGGIADAAARSCISADEYLNGGYAVGLSLAAFPSTDTLSDGVSTLNMHVVFEAKISSTNPALYVDFFVQSEKLVVCQGGLMTYEN